MRKCFPVLPDVSDFQVTDNNLGPLFVNVVAAILNMGFSAYYHNCHCISKVAMDLYLKFDLAGIAIMIGGSATPVLYYAFMCKEYTAHKWIYLGLVWAASIGALFVVMSPSSRNSTNNWIFALSFIAAGCSALPGVVHLIFYMEEQYVRQFPYWIFLLAGAFYVFGACIFAMKWPERRFPFIFDNFGNSHNIFHVCVVIGAVMTWWGSVRIFHER